MTINRFFGGLLLSLALLASCTKEEPKIDYSAEVKLYRVGDDSFIKEMDQSSINLAPFRFFGTFDNGSREVFILTMEGPSITAPGTIIAPREVLFVNPYYLAPLGNTKTIESGHIEYVGPTENNGVILRFVDLTFKCKRTDDSGIVDTYLIRGTLTHEE